MVAPYDRAAIEALVARYGSPLLLVDCDVIRDRYRRLQAALPGVELHYALKPLPDAAVVAALKGIGGRFDLASGGEVELVRAAGVPPEHCIHTHPIKRDVDIREALRYGVRTFVADNVDELGKFVRHRRRAGVMLRVAFSAEDAVVDLSRKFGCEPEAVPELLSVARRLGVEITGLSFHVGSQTPTPAMHVRAIEACGRMIAAARAAGHGALSILDIGGGFPADYREPAMPIEAFCAPIRAALAALPPGLRVLAEPGRYIAAPAGTAVATVMGRALRDGRWWFYLDDGLYGSYSGQLFDHMRYPVAALRTDGPRVPAVLTGPTCDSIDVIDDNLELPLLEAGDLVVGREMGAYTAACATDFNFFRRARVVAVNVEADDANGVTVGAR
ncbi:MAG: type III PLP-dependent enzyme [Proteobacteria bacterium]|nr:type III PLP-dependent enzyme [Pseudomonadota bacterium]